MVKPCRDDRGNVCACIVFGGGVCVLIGSGGVLRKKGDWKGKKNVQ